MSEELKTFNNVLIVIDPAQKEQYALKRALKMNEILDGGVKVHLFISFEMDELRKNQDTFDFYCDSEWFADLIKPLVKGNVEYTAEVYWTADWHHSILRSAERNNVDFIILSDYATEDSRVELSAAKWSLLRASNCPVMIVHPATQIQRKTILAAVNMQTDNTRYVDLNQKILDLTHIMSTAYGAEKHIVNAYEDSMEFPDRAKLLRDTETKQHNTHVHLGDPVEVISEVAEEIDADVVIIGTLSRRGIMAAMRGNKCEEIIRRIKRDVIILN
ncbi:MAG: universal stress protein [Emcibacter sp.]|nr:universal stress protein [Emcibacter sp.]